MTKWLIIRVGCILATGVALVSACGDCFALPPGRTWTPASTLTLPGIFYLATPRMDVDSLGRPALIAHEEGPGENDDLDEFVWNGSSWELRWKLGEGTLIPWPVMSPSGTDYLIWGGAESWNTQLLSLGRIFAGGVAQRETVTITAGARTEYSAAVGAHRRWAAVSDLVPNLSLRVFFSDTFKVWREVQTHGLGSNGITLASLDDTTALIVWSNNYEGLKWATLRGTRWDFGGVLPGGDIPNRPRFRPRPSGGHWMAWGTAAPEVYLSTYRGGEWSEVKILTCAYREGPYSQHFSGDPDLSRDDAEYPVIAWDAQFFGANRVCVCVPSDSGYGTAEALDSPNGVLPSVARDRNGDVWVAWWEEFGPLRWLHSYTSTTAGAPRAVGAGRHRALAWTLSEPAPGSWWTVQRSGGHAQGPVRQPQTETGADGTFEDVARVRAGESSELSWVDDSPPGGLLRYRVRRDCVDKRYEVTSDEATWPPQSIKPHAMRLAVRNAAPESEFELVGAEPGLIEVRVYDVQGRLVHRQSDTAAPGERKTFRLGWSAQGTALRSGVYFVRVRDALGQESNTVKTVLLK